MNLTYGDLRKMVRVASILASGGYHDMEFLGIVAELRSGYICEVGLRKYLSQVFGPACRVSASDCAFYNLEGEQMDAEPNGADLLTFVEELGEDNLPFRVIVREGEEKGEVSVYTL